jgi:uncharacterized protein (DUF58 family)
MFRRLSHALARVALWPLRALSRLTSDGGLFIGLAVLCGLLSAGSNRWSNIPLLMCLVMFSLWLLAMWQGTRSLRGLVLKRSHTERVFANEPLSVLLQVTNSSRMPAAGLVLTEKLEDDRTTRTSESAGAAPAVARQNAARAPAVMGSSFITVIPAKGQERARYSIVVRRRGIYRFGETQVETVFPLGFFFSRAQRNIPGRLVVYPRMGEVETGFFEELELALRYVRCSRPSRAEEDFRGMREYRDGDNPKWIHWRSTARTQRTMVKEFEEPQAKRVLLLLDTNLQRLGTHRFSSFELMISFAATVVRDLARRGYEVECAALQPQGQMIRVTVARERRNLDTLLEMLAGLRRDDSRTLADMSQHVPRRSLHHVYVLALGLGSLRARAALGFLQTSDNVVKILDARGDQFRLIYRPAAHGSTRDDFSNDDMLMDYGDEDGSEEETTARAVASV